MQDSTRDFSVYVLDPLEAPFIPPSADAQQQQQRGGVAVGLGLMSWALLADENESVGVNGTLIKQGQGQGGEQAVEVVFALREVCFYFYLFYMKKHWLIGISLS
jgi:hypothetical protein